MPDEIHITETDEQILDRIAASRSTQYVYGWGARYAGQPRDPAASVQWLEGWDACDRHECACDQQSGSDGSPQLPGN